MLEKIPDPLLSGYVVWVPVLRAGPLEASAESESERIADHRVTQFVDLSGAMSNAYSDVLHLPPPTRAWDVYLVFGPDARWPEGQEIDTPPAPTYWMHQLSGRVAPPELWLDGDRLGDYVRSLLAKMTSPKGSIAEFTLPACHSLRDDLMMANAAPCGSPRTENRRSSMVMGGM